MNARQIKKLASDLLGKAWSAARTQECGRKVIFCLHSVNPSARHSTIHPEAFARILGWPFKWLAYTLLSISLVTVLVAGSVGWWYLQQINPSGDPEAAVNFTVDEGEILCIVGESGSGKSTIGLLVTRLLAPTGGTIMFEGEDITRHDRKRMRPIRRRMQMVYQDPYGSLHPRQTVDRLLAEPLAIHGLGDAEARIARALDEVGLGSGFRFRFPHQLSGGQRQRVAIARALMLEPQVLLLDEPTSALDASVQAETLNLLSRLRDERGLTFLMVSHDLAVIDHMCDRVLVMQHGRAVEEMTRDDLAAARMQTAYARSLFDASADRMLG